MAKRYSHEPTAYWSCGSVCAEQKGKIEVRQPVSRVLSTGMKACWMAIHLGCPLLDTSSNQPGRGPETARPPV